jgi:hypothetical protein
MNAARDIATGKKALGRLKVSEMLSVNSRPRDMMFLRKKHFVIDAG